MGSCEHVDPGRALTWADSRSVASSGSADLTVIPRSIWGACGAPLDGRCQWTVLPLPQGVRELVKRTAPALLVGV